MMRRGTPWTASTMARRLIGLLRDDETLPLREDADLAAEELANPRCPPYMDAIPIAYPQDYGALLDTHGGAVRDAPAYALLEWILTEPDPYEQGDDEEIAASIVRGCGEFAERGHVVIACARQSWRHYMEDSGFSPGDALSFDAGGVCARRDDGLAELPALIQHRYDYLCAFNGDSSEDDNPFTHWDTTEWAASGLLTWSTDNVEDLTEKWAGVCARRDDGLVELPALIQHRYDYLCAFNGDSSEDDNPFTHWDTAQWAASSLLAWSTDNVEDLAEKWAVVCDAQERTRMAWDALTVPDGLQRLIPLLEEMLGADTEADW